MIFFIDQNSENWKSSHLTKGTIMDPNYSLPPNIALITLEVEQLFQGYISIVYSTLDSFCLKLKCFAGVGWWNCASPFGTSIRGESIKIFIILFVFNFK